MNQNFDIQYIRRLIDKFYQGESTPAQEQVLAKYFCESSDDEIPQDLLGDAQVFRSLSSVQQNDCAIPDDLLGKLEEEIKDEELVKDVELPAKDGGLPDPISKEVPHRWKYFMARISGIAAAACLLWGIITFLHHAPQQTIPSGDLTAHVDNEIENHNETEVTDSITAPTIISTEQTKSAPSHLAQTKPRQKVSRQSATIPDGSAVIPSEDASDDFIEITDPEEARQIMKNIGNLLATNFSESDKAMNTVSASIESYKEITKTILQ